MTTNLCDVLCLSPHTDDAEIALGGTLALLARRRQAVWTCDLTRGELASNADPDERWREAAEASEVLGLAGRLQLELPDGYIGEADRTQVDAVVWVLRALQPRWILTAPEPRRHPDHLATPPLVQRAVFLARLASLEVDRPAHRAWGAAERLSPPGGPWITPFVAGTTLPDQSPSLFMDVSSTWQIKEAALACYRSQFERGRERRHTHINDPDFLDSVRARGRAWGRRAGVEHAEALSTAQIPVWDGMPEGRYS